MSEIWFSSDLHFFHDRAFIYEPRGFSSVEEMNEVLLENFNKEISDSDQVYLLGDLMLGNTEEGLKLLKSIKGFKWIIIGNHDTGSRILKYNELFNCEVIGYASLQTFSKRNRLYLSHYPTIMGNFEEKKKTCLHGHTHSKDKLQYIGNGCINVAVDAWDNKPVHMDEVLKIKSSISYMK